METVTMLDLRSRGRDVVRRLERGERMALTYRGKRVAVLIPEGATEDGPIPADDAIHQFVALAEPMATLTSEDIDQALYGESNFR